jgi:enoyl-CoA hydratase
MAAFETILVERPDPRVVRIVMNRPEARNAQNLQMTYDLNAAFDDAVQDDAVKVVILAGSGPHFSAGHDLRPTAKNAAGVDFPPGRKLGRLRGGGRPWPLCARAGDLSADHPALAQSRQADHR